MSDIKLKLNKDSVQRILGMGEVVGKNFARPTLTGVQFIVKGGELTLVATDSHKLGVIHTAGGPNDKIEGEGEALLQFSQLERAFRFFLSDAHVERPDRTKEYLVLETNGVTADVKCGWLNTSIIQVRSIDASFPSWETLFNGPWRASELGVNPVLDGNTPLPLFNVEYLSNLKGFFGGARRMLHAEQAIQIRPAKPGSEAALAPWLFTSHSGVWEYSFLLMPLRPPS